MAQQVEAGGLNPPQYGFESHWGHRLQRLTISAGVVTVPSSCQHFGQWVWCPDQGHKSGLGQGGTKPTHSDVA